MEKMSHIFFAKKFLQDMPQMLANAINILGTLLYYTEIWTANYLLGPNNLCRESIEKMDDAIFYINSHCLVGIICQNVSVDDFVSKIVYFAFSTILLK